MAGKGKNKRSVCAWNMVGVSGLMPEGCLVQLEVKAIVRRALRTNLIFDLPGTASEPGNDGKASVPRRAPNLPAMVSK
jgi:hypothetical protein